MDSLYSIFAPYTPAAVTPEQAPVDKDRGGNGLPYSSCIVSRQELVNEDRGGNGLPYSSCIVA